MIVTPRRALIAAVIVGSAMPARAQLAGERIRGRIRRAEGDLLEVMTREGTEVVLRLGPESAIAALRRVPLAELVPGTQLGVVAEPAGEGLRAVAVSVLPPTATRQFQSAWDLSPGSTMNNGPVAALVAGADAHALTLTINGQAVVVRVDAATSIVQSVPATRADLRPGAAVLAAATRGPDGALVAQRVTVERDGVAPPS
jgi:hypothetical protein